MDQLGIKFKNTFTDTSVRDVNEVCNPLFQNKKIGHFCYSKYYKKADALGNMKIACLGTNGYWMDYVFSHGIYPSTQKLKPGISLLAENFPKLNTRAKKLFSLHGFCILSYDHPDYFELIGFASKTEDITSFYLSHLDILYKFVFYFKDKATRLINLVDQNSFLYKIPAKYPSAQNSFEESTQDKGVYKQLIQALQLKKYNFDIVNQHLSLTRKEMECLVLISKGKTEKEAGNKLNISRKTVEFHLENIKHKLNKCNKSQLLSYLEENNLLKILNLLI